MQRVRSTLTGLQGVVVPSQTESSTKSRDEAERRLEIIKPLVARPGRTRAEVAERANKFGLNAKTLYRWLAKYESTLDISSLSRRKRSDGGGTRLPPATEDIIAETFRNRSEFYNFVQIAQFVSSQCLQKGTPAPHNNTLRARLRAFRLARRAAIVSQLKHSAPVLPAANPGELVEISYLPLEISVIDQHTFRVAKPWVTALFGVRQSVLGFWISAERPGTFEVGQCIACAVLPKEEFLPNSEIADHWPSLRAPSMLVANLEKPIPVYLKRACADYGVTLKHIKRRIHPSSAQEFHAKLLSYFEPASTPLLSFEEFRDRLIKLIASYNRERGPAAEIGSTERNNDGVAGAGSPSLDAFFITDPAAIQRVYLDFMPSVERTVQHYGVMIDGISYSGSVLSRWMHAGGLNDEKNNQQFLIRRDPRDIKTVWFFDPEKDKYFPLLWNVPVPSHLTLPPISLRKCLELKSRFRKRWIKDGITNATFRSMLAEFMEALFKHRPKLPPETEAELEKLGSRRST